MFCLYCGTNLPDDAVFCNSCGKRQDSAANTLATDVVILPGPPLPGAPIGDGQPPAEDVPIVQGTPSMPNSSSMGKGAANSGRISGDPVSTQPQAISSHTEPSRTSYAPHPRTAPQSASSERVKLTGHLSRREVIVGLAGGTVAVVAGGSLTWLALSKRQQGPFPSSTPPHLPLGTLLATHRTHGTVDSIAWSPDGRRIASSSDNTVEVWSAIDGGHTLVYHGHTDEVFAVAWSPDGKRIASGSYDQTVQVWDAIDGGNAFTYRGHTGSVLAVAWSPDSRRIASGGEDKTVQVWDAVTGGNVYTYHGHVTSSPLPPLVETVAWSPDGRRIASGAVDAQVWDATTGSQIVT